MKCPVCETSDFKFEDGCYVCQICGNKIKEGTGNAPAANNKSGDKPDYSKKLGSIISAAILVYLAYIGVTAILSSFSGLSSAMGFVTMLINVVALAPVAYFLIPTIKELLGKPYKEPMQKRVYIILYAIARLCVSALVMAVYGYFSILLIIYPIIYTVLMILAVEKVKKKFNKE